MNPHALLLRPTGPLTAEACHGLRQQFATAFAHGVTSIAVDLSAVSEVDVSGLQVLAGAAKHLRKRQGLLVVTHVPAHVASMLRVNGLSELLEVPASAPLRVVAGEKEPDRGMGPVQAAPRLRVVQPGTAG